MKSNLVEVRDLTWTYYPDGFVLDRISFDLSDGEIVGIVGPNGCGKTTLLHLLVGLLKPSRDGDLSGEILVRPQQSGKPLSGFVFQSYRASLLPWRTLYGNVTAGLELLHAVSRKIEEEDDIVRRWLERLGLGQIRNRFPHEISGGQAQLTCLARALALNADFIILDEPTGSLHYDVRNIVLDILLEERQKHNKTILFTSHSLEEAALLADRVIILTHRPASIRSVEHSRMGRERTTRQLGSPAHLDVYRSLVTLTSSDVQPERIERFVAG